MEHSRYGASGAKRWINCPGSVRQCKAVKSKTSAYADNGTSAHGVSEYCSRQMVLADKKDIAKYINVQPDHLKQYVNEEMCDKVNIYLEAIYERLKECKNPIMHVEKRFNLDWLSEGMFGTNDNNIIDPGRKIYIGDLKFGAGVGVEVYNNPQLMYYALGALGEKNEYEVDEVEIMIGQPNYDHPDGAIRSQVMSVEDLYAWAYDVLKPAVEKAKHPNAKLCTGDWCKTSFCDAIGVCPAIFDETKKLAQIDFADDVIEQPRIPENMTDVELAKVLDSKALIVKWLNEVEKLVLERMVEGIKIDGYKMVKKRANRKWVDEKKTTKFFNLIYGDKIYTPKKLKSPAQMEKVVCDKSELDGLWEKPDTGYTLAKSGDKRIGTDRNKLAKEDFDVF